MLLILFKPVIATRNSPIGHCHIKFLIVDRITEMNPVMTLMINKIVLTKVIITKTTVLDCYGEDRVPHYNPSVPIIFKIMMIHLLT